MLAWSSFGPYRIRHSHFTSSLCSDQQPPPLDGLAPIYGYLHRRLKECFASSFGSVSGSLAAAPPTHLVSLYLQSFPSAPLHLFALQNFSRR